MFALALARALPQFKSKGYHPVPNLPASGTARVLIRRSVCNDG